MNPLEGITEEQFWHIKGLICGYCRYRVPHFSRSVLLPTGSMRYVEYHRFDYREIVCPCGPFEHAFYLSKPDGDTP